MTREVHVAWSFTQLEDRVEISMKAFANKAKAEKEVSAFRAAFPDEHVDLATLDVEEAP